MESVVAAPAAGSAGQATPCEAELGAFVAAALMRGGTDADAIAAARSGVERVLGPTGVVQVAAVIGMFDGINKLADITGCQTQENSANKRRSPGFSKLWGSVGGALAMEAPPNRQTRTARL